MFQLEDVVDPLDVWVDQMQGGSGGLAIWIWWFVVSYIWARVLFSVEGGG